MSSVQHEGSPARTSRHLDGSAPRQASEHPETEGSPGLGAGVARVLAGLTSQIHLRHQWITVEAIGHVVTQRCATCRRIRVRVQGG
ncbi:hypothetical protein ABZU32_38665 [Sphaerisporangium sp. NPDC005288]|uniref:hypothetical protein n=1 Tax=Sphaerisporangium sp. NPDC005288 TaxID=3155114 RepID=UPI0033B54E63